MRFVVKIGNRKGQTFESDAPHHVLWPDLYALDEEGKEEAPQAKPEEPKHSPVVYEGLPEGWEVKETERGWYGIFDENGEQQNDKRLRLGKVQAFIEGIE